MRGSSWLLGTCIFVGACQGKFGSTEEKLVPPPSPRPTYGKTVTLPKAPPAISGGTLIVSRDLSRAISADPDRDRVSIADLASGKVDTVALSAGDEPGRAIEDDKGRVHVVLRGGGAIATIDLASKSLVSRRAVCPAPRGIAHHFAKNRLYVACAGGELASFDGDAATPTMLANLGRDLRDVAVNGDTLFITRFRAAEVLVVGLDGEKHDEFKLASLPIGPGKSASPEVAWRMVSFVDGRLAIAHQRARQPGDQPVSTGSGGYSDTATNSPGEKPCGLGIVHSAVSLLVPGGGVVSLPPISDAVLPVDLAVNGTSQVALVAAGNGHTPELQQVYVFDAADTKSLGAGCIRAPLPIAVEGQPTAAAWANATLVVQTREPAALRTYSPDGKLLRTIDLGGESREDTGHAIFHSNAGGFMACASCHPEGGDDGHVWSFDDLGPRRTQNLRGGVLGTEPFHWDGTLTDLHALMGEVFTKRMSGAALGEEQLGALSHFVESIPLIPVSTPSDPTAVSRGELLYRDAGCATCHGGAKLTNNQTVDVGTGPMQVPSLRGIAFRAPFMHTGCATTLADRFSPSCGGAAHGNLAGLGQVQLRDLVVYLETL